MSYKKLNKVCANFAQDFTLEEQAQARTNIGAQAALTAGSGITIQNNVISASGGGGQGGYRRNNAELYLFHRGDGEHYHVRNILNNCINHVAVTNMSNVICSLLVEAPELEPDEEQNYFVQFDCVGSAGSCNVDVENAAPRIVDGHGFNVTGMYLKTAISTRASDAIEKEAFIKTADNTNRYLQINGASYYGVTQNTRLAGPFVVTSVEPTSYSRQIDRNISFSGSPTYMVRVIGGMFEVFKF